MMNKRKIILFALLYLIIITIPYLLASKIVDNTHVFGGFLINPIDGNSYLAKMQLGYRGDWKFDLLYSSKEGEGAYLFLFYIFLGHIARWTGCTLLTVFHISRVISWMIFLVLLIRFLNLIFSGFEELVFPALVLCSLGSGLGWVVFLFGEMSADFWVAEAYPFLSSFTNPHFISGMACFLWVVNTSLTNDSPMKKGAIIWLAGILLAIVMPFGVVICGLVCFSVSCWSFWKERKFHSFVSPIALGLGGGLLVIYQYWQTLRDPLLVQWNEQNITPSPELWDVLVSFSPALIFAVIGIYFIIRDKETNRFNLLLFWFLGSFLLLYFPFALQRRFIFGLFIPVSILSVWGVHKITGGKSRLRNRLMMLLSGFSVLTNVFLLLSGLLAVQSNHPRLVLSTEERMAMNWIQDNTLSDAVVLCSPEIGNFIPAYTGRRVIYGHPFETPGAEEMEAWVIGFFRGDYDMDDIQSMRQTYYFDWVFYGQREKGFGLPAVLEEFALKYQNEKIAIYQLQ